MNRNDSLIKRSLRGKGFVVSMNLNFDWEKILSARMRSSQPTEGFLREALAVYFLSVPPPAQQSPQERERYRRALHSLAELDAEAVLQSEIVRRPLRFGDVGLLLRNTLYAAAICLSERGTVLECEIPDQSLCMAADPRTLQIAVVRLLQSVSAANPDATVKARVTARPRSLTLMVAGKSPVRELRTLALVRAAAREHKGGVALSGGTVAFSLRRELTSPIGRFTVPSIEEMVADALSAVNVGLA